MSRICEICGKHPAAGRKMKRRGLAKIKGGVGRRITGVTKRRFMPNLQTVRALIKGKPRRILICTGCLKAGKVVKAA
jgi:large subunit ribosomal protein L28